MKFKKFQRLAKRTETYSNPENSDIAYAVRMEGLMYAGLGLSGEAGEVADEIKKMYRDGQGFTEKRMQNIFWELGDVLWYVAACCNELGFDMDEVAQANCEKLAERYAIRNADVEDNGVA